MYWKSLCGPRTKVLTTLEDEIILPGQQKRLGVSNPSRVPPPVVSTAPSGAPRYTVFASRPLPTLTLLQGMSFLPLILNSSSRSGQDLASSRKPSVITLSHTSSPFSKHPPPLHLLRFCSAPSGWLPHMQNVNPGGHNEPQYGFMHLTMAAVIKCSPLPLS